MQDRAPSSRHDHLRGEERQVEQAPPYLRTYENEVDLFLVYCPETDGIYAIPIEEATSSVGALRVAPTANGQAKRIRWATEYQLPE
jgi:hypothetical protein